jgi:hypothetical protein
MLWGWIHKDWIATILVALSPLSVAFGPNSLARGDTEATQLDESKVGR